MSGEWVNRETRDESTINWLNPRTFEPANFQTFKRLDYDCDHDYDHDYELRARTLNPQPSILNPQ